MKPVVVLSVNTTWNVFNFRAGLVRALVAAGYDVVVVAPDDAHRARVEALGCRCIALEMDKNGTNPVRDLALLWRYFRLLRRCRPVAYLGFTAKPNIYGSLAAQALGIPVINNIAGLGSGFDAENWLRRVLERLYKSALNRSHLVFFQNADDRKLFQERGIVRGRQCKQLPGSGIDLRHFCRSHSKRKNGPMRFLLVARLLREKGIGEYAKAARALKHEFPNAVFGVLGLLDEHSKAAMPPVDILRWIGEGLITYLGAADDVRVEISNADCVVLPSYYREGVPRSLLEAAAMAKPLITTDTIGCRDVVRDGVNGFLCRPRDATDLADKMRLMLEMPVAHRLEMGRQSRAVAETKFDEAFIIEAYLDALNSLPKGAKAPGRILDPQPVA